MIIFFILFVTTVIITILICLNQIPIIEKPPCNHKYSNGMSPFNRKGDEYWVGNEHYPASGYLYVKIECYLCKDKSVRKVSEAKVFRYHLNNKIQKFYI